MPSISGSMCRRSAHGRSGAWSLRTDSSLPSHRTRGYSTNAWGSALPCGHSVPKEASEETLRCLLRHLEAASEG
jgi:hypothetical protein